jgi:hypothetical protein
LKIIPLYTTRLSIEAQKGPIGLMKKKRKVSDEEEDKEKRKKLPKGKSTSKEIVNSFPFQKSNFEYIE